MTATWHACGEDEWLVVDTAPHRLLAIAPLGMYPLGLTIHIPEGTA